MGDLPRPRLMERVTPDRQGPLVSSLNTTIIIIGISSAKGPPVSGLCPIEVGACNVRLNCKHAQEEDEIMTSLLGVSIFSIQFGLKCKTWILVINSCIF